MNISENGVTFDVTLTYRSRKSLMEKGGAGEGNRTFLVIHGKNCRIAQ
jgi:hypothetical protein